MTILTILRAGPLTTLQDSGRFGMLRHGISASGPMDRVAFAVAGAALPMAGATSIEFTQGLAFEVDGPLTIASPEVRELKAGDRVELPPATVITVTCASIAKWTLPRCSEAVRPTSR